MEQGAYASLAPRNCLLSKSARAHLRRPASQAENKFKCPCHGSQYNDEGKVIRGPAPLVRVPGSGCHSARTEPPATQSLALAHMSVAEDDTVLFSPWTETDFRYVRLAAGCGSGSLSRQRFRVQHWPRPVVEVDVAVFA